jgi:hypothetical protein
MQSMPVGELFHVTLARLTVSGERKEDSHRSIAIEPP